MRRTAAAALLLTVTPLVAACSGDDDAPVAHGTSTTAARGSTGSTTTTTTVDDGADPPEVGDPCAALGAGLAAAGIPADPSQLVPRGEDGCASGPAGQGYVLDVRNDVDSSVFEAALAEATGDPFTVDGVGEMAAVLDLGAARRLVVLAEQRLVTIEGVGSTREQLVGVATAVLAGL